MISTGLNTEYCAFDNMFMSISSVSIIIILLWLIQTGMLIEDALNQYNTKTIMIITTIFGLIVIFILFDLVSNEAKKSNCFRWMFYFNFADLRMFVSDTVLSD